MNIILVDDERVQLDTLKRGLRSLGHQVFEAQSVSGALDRLAKIGDNIDMLITDYKMPGRNGLDLIREVHAGYGHILVILMTAFGDKTMLAEAFQNHRCDGFIEKPFTLEDLTAEIDHTRHL